MGNKIDLNFIIKQIKNKKGFALLGTLILVFVVSSFGIALLTMTRNEIKSSALQKASTETFYIAESGIEHAISYLENLGTTPNFPSTHYLTEENDHYIDIGNGKYKASIQSATTFSYIINSVGERPWNNISGKISKTIECKVILENFAMYAYFSNKETFPDDIYPPYGGRKIWFYGKDIIKGPLHSNDRIHIAGSPTFKGKVTSSYDGDWEAYDSQTNPHFEGDPPYLGGVNEIPLPTYREITLATDANSLQRIAAGSQDFIENHVKGALKGAYVPDDGFNVTDGIWVYGKVETLVLGIDSQGNSQIIIIQTGGINKTTTITTIETPVTIEGTTYPSGTTLVDVYKGATHTYSNPNGFHNGVLFVNGEIKNLRSTAGDGGVKGKLTIASNNTITIGNDILYKTRIENENCFIPEEGENFPNFPDSLGLVSEENIMVADGAPHNIEINAIMMALETSFYYEGWKHNKQGVLKVHGSFIQRQRGPVGTFSSWGKVSGYTKDYIFDTRMSIGNPKLGEALPPYFPTTGKYIQLYWDEL